MLHLPSVTFGRSLERCQSPARICTKSGVAIKRTSVGIGGEDPGWGLAVVTNHHQSITLYPGRREDRLKASKLHSFACKITCLPKISGFIAAQENLWCFPLAFRAGEEIT